MSSAWSFAAGLLAWSLFKGSLDRKRGSAWVWPLLTLVATVCVLDHAMSGLFTRLGLFVIAVTRPARRRWRCAGGTVLMAQRDLIRTFVTGGTITLIATKT